MANFLIRSVTASDAIAAYGYVRDEYLNQEIFSSLKEAQMVIELRRVEYNTRRPHSALGYKLPVAVSRSPLVSPNPVSRRRAVMGAAFLAHLRWYKISVRSNAPHVYFSARRVIGT